MGAHFWLGRLTGFGAVTLPKETIRPLGLHNMGMHGRLLRYTEFMQGTYGAIMVEHAQTHTIPVIASGNSLCDSPILERQTI